MDLSKIKVLTGIPHKKDMPTPSASTGGIVPPPISKKTSEKELGALEYLANIYKAKINPNHKTENAPTLATENDSAYRAIDYDSNVKLVRNRNANYKQMSIKDFLEEGGQITEEGIAIDKNGLPFQGVLTFTAEKTDAQSKVYASGKERAIKTIEYDIYGRPITILYHIPSHRNDVITSIKYDENNKPSKSIISETITPLGQGYETSPIYNR